MQGVQLVLWGVLTGLSNVAREELTLFELGSSFPLAAKGDYAGYGT